MGAFIIPFHQQNESASEITLLLLFFFFLLLCWKDSWGLNYHHTPDMLSGAHTQCLRSDLAAFPSSSPSQLSFYSLVTSGISPRRTSLASWADIFQEKRNKLKYPPGSAPEPTGQGETRGRGGGRGAAAAPSPTRWRRRPGRGQPRALPRPRPGMAGPSSLSLPPGPSPQLPRGVAGSRAAPQPCLRTPRRCPSASQEASSPLHFDPLAHRVLVFLSVF